MTAEEDTPAHQHHAQHAQEVVTLRTVFNMVSEIHAKMSIINGQLATGAANMANLVTATGKIDPLLERVIRAEETIGTLKILVYSAVGLMLFGVFVTGGAAVIWAISKGGVHP